MAVYERRYVLCPVETAEFVGELGSLLVPEVHEPSRPISYTRTTYLDTPDHEYLRSSLRGVARRVRVRQYASARGLHDTPLITSPGYLELKESFGASRLKRRLGMAPRVLAGVLSGKISLAEILGPESLPPLARLVGQLHRGELRPTLTTWYRRVSFLGRDDAVRVTIDRRIAFAAGEPVGEVGERGAPARVLAAGPTRVLEVKCDGTPPAWLARALSGLREAAWFTKYRCGMELLHQARLAA